MTSQDSSDSGDSACCPIVECKVSIETIHAFVDELSESLKSPEARTRACVARILGLVGDRRAIDALRSCLDDVDETVRKQAAQSLSLLGYIQVARPVVAEA